jgi:hypothetical protein
VFGLTQARRGLFPAEYFLDPFAHKLERDPSVSNQKGIPRRGPNVIHH